MAQEKTECLFCDIPEKRIFTECGLAYAVRDGHPVTDLHSLIIPKRHISDYFGLSQDELIACQYSSACSIVTVEANPV